MPPLADLALARRLEQAEGTSARRFVEARAQVEPDVHAEWREIAGAYAIYDGPDSPVTQTFGLGLFEPATEDVLKEAEAFFRGRCSAVNLEVSPLAGVELFASLADRGYRPVEFTSVLYRTLDQEPEPYDAAISIRMIEKQDFDLWAKVSTEGWSQDHPEFRDFLLGLGRVTAHKENSPAWLAWIDQEPVAAASLTICDGIAHLAGASTIPSARGKGAHLALLRARLRYAAKYGCDIALMGAQPGSASQRNAERHGFRIAYTRQKWQLDLK